MDALGNPVRLALSCGQTHEMKLADQVLYAERYLVEHYFQKIKRFRRIAMRFEKLARNFLALVQLASVLVWLA